MKSMATTPWAPGLGLECRPIVPWRRAQCRTASCRLVPWFLLATGMIYRHWIHIWAEFHLFICWILLVLSRVLYDLARVAEPSVSGSLGIAGAACSCGRFCFVVWYWDSAVPGAVQGMCRKCAVRWRVLRVSTMKLGRFGQISREPSSNTQCWFVLCLWLFDFAEMFWPQMSFATVANVSAFADGLCMEVSSRLSESLAADVTADPKVCGTSLPVMRCGEVFSIWALCQSSAAQAQQAFVRMKW